MLDLVDLDVVDFKGGVLLILNAIVVRIIHITNLRFVSLKDEHFKVETKVLQVHLFHSIKGLDGSTTITVEDSNNFAESMVVQVVVLTAFKTVSIGIEVTQIPFISMFAITHEILGIILNCFKGKEKVIHFGNQVDSILQNEQISFGIDKVD